MTTYLVVGASLAGLSAARTLRRGDPAATIVVVDPSAELPSDRPPLSKQVLAGEWEPDRAQQPSAPEVPDLDLDLRLGVHAVALDVANRTVTLSDGTEQAADGIVIATGATPRRLPGAPPGGVHVLRDMADSLALRRELDAGPARVAVIGAGFIGAEVAATCRGRGHEVTMIEAAPVPLPRALPAPIGSFVADLHRRHGVDVRLGAGVDHLDADDSGRVRVVRLADGSSVDAEVVVVGIGVIPTTGWLDGSGLDLSDGIVCDSTGLAAPGITAAGDVASWFNEHFGERMRVEHWEHAIEHGEAAATRLLGGDPAAVAFASVPWFWSDQYDAKIQMAGRPNGDDELHVVDGTIEDGRFVVAFRRGERCTGVLGVNRPRLVMQARMRLRKSLAWEPVAELFR